MPWPDIFFKARKPRPEPAEPTPLKSVLEAAKTLGTEPKSPEAKPATAAQAPAPAEPAPAEPAPTSDRSTRTIPVTHGVVLRPSARVVIGPPAEGAAPSAIKNIEQLMTEADPVKTLRQTGSIHLLKRLAPDPNAPPLAPKPAAPVPLKTPPPFSPPASQAGQSPWPEFTPKTPPVSTEVKKPEPIIATAPQSPWPEFAPKTPTPAPVTPPPSPVELKKPEPNIAATPALPPVPTEVAKPEVEEEDESPFILKPSSPAQSKAPAVLPVPETTPLPRISIFRRRAKLADVARIVLPPKREESTRLPFPLHPEPSPTVVPPAFPVAAMTQRPLRPVAEITEPVPAKPETISESPFLERSRANEPTAKLAPQVETPRIDEKPKVAEPAKSTPPPFPGPKPAEPMSLFPDPPKIEPEPAKPAPVVASAPKVDLEAPRPLPQPASPMENVPPSQLIPPVSTALEVSTGSPSQEKREFHLTNGEHVAGVVLSETPEAFYVEHATLGVITVPRKEIAKRLVEIILINGDRIVGDIMAETADTLYVRHASLGMLTVPRAQRSQRVVEAILKDGDRILGEVLTETDTFTVIRSATLGTITVPHTKLAMLNRKLEQIDMKALPAVPELKDK